MKKYEEPQVEIIYFTEDVVKTSGLGAEGKLGDNIWAI